MGHRRTKQERKKLRRLYDETKHSYGAGVWYDEQKHRFIRYSMGSGGRSTFLKKQSNKRVRRAEDVGNHCGYRRHFDYNWELF